MSSRRLDIKKGDAFGRWTLEAIHYARRGPTRATCRCVCGTIRDVYFSHLVQGMSRSCGCGVRRGHKHPQFTGVGDLTGSHWNQIVRNAKGKKQRTPIPIDITIDDAWALYLKQKRRCALTNVKITLGTMGIKTGSLDRIDSLKGYIHGNVQWVHKDINRMKNTFPQSVFIEWCKLVAAANKVE